MTSRIAALAQEAITLQEAEVFGLPGVAKRGDDISEGAFAAALVADDGNKVRIER